MGHAGFLEQIRLQTFFLSTQPHNHPPAALAQSKTQFSPKLFGQVEFIAGYPTKVGI
jgi:hypothetical protein